MAPSKKAKAKRPDDGMTVLNIRLPTELKERLEKAAAARTMSVSAVLRDAVIEDLNRRGF